MTATTPRTMPNRLGLVGLCLVLWLPSTVCAQITTATERERDFLSLGSAVQYDNFAARPFRPFPVFGWETPRYDRLGRYLMPGRVMLSADEQRPGLSRIDGLKYETGNVFQVGAQFNYQVLNDSYRGRNYALMVLVSHDEVELAPVKTQFTPLTLNMTRYTGVRFDVGGAKNKTSLIYSRGTGDRRRFSTFEVGRNEESPVILWGGHWETQIGSALRLGTTFVNQHMVDTNSPNGSIFKGDISHDMRPPETITVRIVDDSPFDEGTPAAAYDVAIIVRGVDPEGEQLVYTGDADLAEEGIEFRAELDPGNPSGGRRVGDHWEADGAELIEFAFDMPDTATFRPIEAEFIASVGGDYRIQVRQDYRHFYKRRVGPRLLFRNDAHQWPAEPRFSALGSENAGYDADAGDLKYPTDFKFPEEVPAYTVARSDGVPTDLRARQVRFDYGFPTAQTLASVDAHLDYAGFAVDGEFSLNTQNFKFPARKGVRSDKDAVAYYLTATRGLPLPGGRGPQLGVELFRIDPDYSGNYDSRRGGAVFHTSVPAVPPNTALTQEFNLFDDNDDRDQWPDDRPQDMALSGANDSGVYPGLDVNGDNVPDTDQNGNGLPDWEEAFLFYWSDPPEFIYDIDFNNNSLPDLTENDDRPDYPYDRDTKGRHAFLSWDRPLPYVELLRLGFYHAETISQGGESDVLYLRYHLGYDVGERGHVKLRGDWKQVEDDIDNPVFLWLTTGNPRDNSLVLQDTEPDPITGAAPGFGLEGLRLTDADPMLMRNSTVNTVNLVADLTPLDRLTWHSSYKWLRNRQHDEELSEGTMQEEETLSRLTMSTRLEYRYPLREHIELFARYRHLFWHDAGYSPATRRHWQTRGPLFEEVVRLTERTELVAGQEGIPWLMPVTHTDYDDDARDFDRWTNVFMLRMQGQYIGWKTVSEIGLQLERLEAEAGEQSNRTFFVEMYFGF